MLMPDGMRGKKRLRNMLYDHATRSVHAIKLFPDGARELMYSPEYYALVRDHDPYARMMNEYRGVPHLDMTAAMQYVDSRVYLPDDILVKVDKASMLNSLETRAPLLDQHLVEYVSSLSSKVRTPDGTLKYLLKKVAADMLPAEILTRRKQGFAAPIKHWFRGDLTNYASDLLDSPRARQRGIFNPQFIRDLLKAHATTSWVNYSEAIWALLCLELWFQVYIDEPSIRVEERSQTQVTSSR